MAIDTKSLYASIFLMTSLYVLYRAGTASPGTALIEVGFIVAIGFCMYFSYRLILIINETLA